MTPKNLNLNKHETGSPVGKLNHTEHRNMTKKIASTSNVPNNNSNSNINNHNINNTPPKMKNNHKNHHSQHQNPNQNGIINSKHVHNQSHPQKPKNNKETTSGLDGNNENGLMKKLFEAVQKQKEKEKDSAGVEITKRTRKATAPLPKTMNSSETYAGAAFDRAPAATSFPIPSFIKTGASETGGCGPALSSSCPLPGGLNSNENEKNLKKLTLNDLFKTTKSNGKIEVFETKIPTEKNEKKKLESLTNDLRKILNLR